MPEKKVKIPKWDKIAKSAAVSLHAGTLEGGLSDEMISAQAELLWKGIETSFDAESLAMIDEVQMAALKENIFYFSGFKNLQQMKEASTLLTGADGQVRSFADFFKDFQQIDNTYNKVYLEAEYNFATNASQSISLWHRVQNEKDALPYLQWSAVHDSHTRADHMALDGITLPTDHVFWHTHWVPFDWNCRCLIRQMLPDAKVTHDDDLKGLKPADPYFSYNPGRDNVIFPTDKDRFTTVHPYAANTTKAEYKAVVKRVDDLKK